MREPELPSEPVSEQQTGQHAAGEPANEPDQTHPPKPHVSTSGESDNQKSPYHCKVTCRIEKNWWDKTKPFVEVAGIVLLAIYTFYTIKMYCSNKKAAEAAESAANVSQKALVQANRPWLSAEHLIFTAPVQIVKIGPPDLYMLQAMMAYKYEIRNYGKDPALRVHYHAEALESRLGTDNVDSRQDFSCKAADGEFFKDIGNGAAVFPNDYLEAVNDNAPGILFQPREIFGNEVPDATKGTFYVAGCASYEDQFFDITRRVHHTRFCFISDKPLGQIAMGDELRRCRREIRAD
jgi:hypothetical protein